MLGLLPMALSHGIGSETQEPLAIIIFTEAGHHLGSLLSGLVFADSDFTIVTTD